MLPVSTDPIIAPVLPTVLGRLHSERSRKEYLSDMKEFAKYLHNSGFTHPCQITYADMVAYQHALAAPKENGKTRSRRRINRLFTVARAVLDVHHRMGQIARNPADGIEGLPVGDDDSPHIALDKEQAEAMLAAIDTTTRSGKQKYAIIALLLRTGLRRSECASLNVGNLDMTSGHFIIRLTGKGGRKAIVKLPVDVKRYIQEWLEASGRTQLHLDAPLFVGFRKGDHPTENRISPRAIERIVIESAASIGLRFTPHSLRASFITLALENKATLTQVQYAARHKDPRQTERYQRRKINLDDNAVDKLSFLARGDR